MRTLATLVATSFVALMVASTASAAPSVSFVWIGTSGSGTTGTSSIDANAGDVVVMDIQIAIDSTGLAGAFVGLTYNSNELLPLLGYGNPGIPGSLASLGYTSICPPAGTTNPIGPDTCSSFSTPSRVLTPIGDVSATLSANNVGAGSELAQFNAAKGAPPFPVNGTMTLGRVFFTVLGSGDVSSRNSTLADGIVDSAGNTTFPPASATVVVPEPTTVALLGLGVFGLAVAGRRRS